MHASMWLPLVIAIGLALLGIWIASRQSQEIATGLFEVMGAYVSWIAAVVLVVVQIVLWVLHFAKD